MRMKVPLEVRDVRSPGQISWELEPPNVRWVLWIELRFSGRAARTLNQWALPPVPTLWFGGQSLKLASLARFWPPRSLDLLLISLPSTELQVTLPFLGFMLGLGSLSPCSLAVSPAPWGSNASKHWGHVPQLIIKIKNSEALKHTFKVGLYLLRLSRGTELIGWI